MRSTGSGYASVVSRRHVLPFRRANGCARPASGRVVGRSLLVTCVRPLDSVVEEAMLSERAVPVGARSFLAVEEAPEVLLDLRCAANWAPPVRARAVWLAACL